MRPGLGDGDGDGEAVGDALGLGVAVVADRRGCARLLRDGLGTGSGGCARLECRTCAAEEGRGVLVVRDAGLNSM